jgi:hypothetical protein
MKVNKLNLILESKEHFLYWVKKCNGDYRLVTPSLYLYKKIIEKHRLYKDIDTLLKDDEFIELIYITLIAWNMDQRGAKLTSFEEFKESIFQNQSILKELYAYRLWSLTKEDLTIVLEKLKRVFYELKVMKSKSKIVGVSKALHFLLPDLVMPVDRRYTMDFFYGHNAYSQDISKEFKTFKEIFTKFYEISKKLQLSDKDVDDFNWNTSVPKLIDNAIIGIKNFK